MNGLLAIAIDPCYISKAGKKTAHIGTFWSGCVDAMKQGLFILCIILCTQCCKCYDEGEWIAVLHGII